MERNIYYRYDVMRSVNNSLPKNITEQFNGMRLVSEQLDSKTYTAVWETEDHKRQIILSLLDLETPNYPVLVQAKGIEGIAA